MNESDMYLFQILQKYNPRNLVNYSHPIFQLKNMLKTWANGCYVDILESGSRAKGTAISIASDVDFLISLTSNCNENNGGLEGIYNSLYSKLKSVYSSARKQNVSVKIDLFGNTLLAGNLEVDITPARKQSDYTNDHSLWVSKLSTWKKTNISRHIADVLSSGRINEIKLLKIWRELNKLDFPSIYLEYLLIENILFFKLKDSNCLANNFWHILLELAKDNGNPLYSRIVDPANSSNILSELLTDKEKNIIISKAKYVTTQANQSWGNIVW